MERTEWDGEKLPLPVMPVLVLGIGKRVGDCDGLSIGSIFEPCAMSFDDNGFAVSLSELSSDDESADSKNIENKVIENP